MKGKIMIGVVILVMPIFVLPRMAAQDSAKKGNSNDTATKTQTLTGCIRLGDVGSEYKLVLDDGAVWNIASDSSDIKQQVKVGAYVGRTVTVTGNRIPNSYSHKERAKVRESYAGTVVMSGLTVVTESCTQDSDPFIGTWKTNLAKSKENPGPPLTSSVTIKREPADYGAVETTTDAVDAQGKPTHTERTAEYDGKDHPVTGSQNYDTVAAARIGSNTRIQVYKKDGNVVRILLSEISEDGKTETNDDFGAYGSNPVFHNTDVLEKQ